MDQFKYIIELFFENRFLQLYLVTTYFISVCFLIYNEYKYFKIEDHTQEGAKSNRFPFKAFTEDFTSNFFKVLFETIVGGFRVWISIQIIVIVAVLIFLFILGITKGLIAGF